MNSEVRIKRHKKIKRRVYGISGRPRLSVFRTSKYIYAQVIDDINGRTMAQQSDIKLKGLKKTKAFEVGKKLAAKMKLKKIEKIVFDRGGFLYHGRIAELARGLREGGIKF